MSPRLGCVKRRLGGRRPMQFADHFSSRAPDYARFRPSYPPALLAFLRGSTSRHRLAWDCGAGSGQAAVMLAGAFDQVVATDPSAAQLASAHAHPNVTYRLGRESTSGLQDSSVDLVTAAQAAHWFDLPAFYREVDRVIRPGGVVAMWCYDVMTISPEIDRPLRWLYGERLAPYWPDERRLVETGYRTLQFPYAPVAAPALSIEASLDRTALLGYIGTWSAVTRCISMGGGDPVAEFAGMIEEAWPRAEEVRPVRWPLAVLAGRAGPAPG
ncbi:MAG TPA: class I SAM-dependent methyltransferase [Candidatus Polarisedimenticolia bacterium]|nr:class I SAM-dependent methyltransferase [Candidatus Polarisedimenticolia bacterium]